MKSIDKRKAIARQSDCNKASSMPDPWNNLMRAAESYHASRQLPRAAIYVRSATNDQKQIDQQISAIRTYAKRHKIEIVKTYTDWGKPNVHSHEIKNMMAAIRNETAGFSAILLYDVSRWGRYPDSEIHLYYEHACYCAGIDVHYIGEEHVKKGKMVPCSFPSIFASLVKYVSRR